MLLVDYITTPFGTSYALDYTMRDPIPHHTTKGKKPHHATTPVVGDVVGTPLRALFFY